LNLVIFLLQVYGLEYKVVVRFCTRIELRTEVKGAVVIQTEQGRTEVPLTALPPSPDIDFASSAPIDFGYVNYNQSTTASVKLFNKGLKLGRFSFEETEWITVTPQSITVVWFPFPSNHCPYWDARC
jgi:hypothetical protein